MMVSALLSTHTRNQACSLLLGMLGFNNIEAVAPLPPRISLQLERDIIRQQQCGDVGAQTGGTGYLGRGAQRMENNSL